MKKSTKEYVEKIKIDGDILVAILDVMIKQAKEIHNQLIKECKKKNSDMKIIHDLKIRSMQLSLTTSEMLKVVIRKTKQKEREK